MKCLLKFYTATWLAPILVVDILIVISLMFYRKNLYEKPPGGLAWKFKFDQRKRKKRDENAARLLRFNEFLFSQRWRRLQNIYSTLISYVYRATDSVETYKQQHSPKNISKWYNNTDEAQNKFVRPSAGTFVRPSVRASTGGYQLFA